MLPKHHKLHASQEFSRVIRRGSRAGTRTLVVHLSPDATPAGGGTLSASGAAEPAGAATVDGPRFGFVVSKAVGNAVTRHAVTRKLRHQCQELSAAGLFLPGDEVVIRALPMIAQADSRQIRADISRAVARARRRG